MVPPRGRGQPSSPRAGGYRVESTQLHTPQHTGPGRHMWYSPDRREGSPEGTGVKQGPWEAREGQSVAPYRVGQGLSHSGGWGRSSSRCWSWHQPGPADLFSECYSNSADRAFALLVRRNRSWSRTTCLHLATEADTKTFFAHDGVQVRCQLRGASDARQAGGPRPSPGIVWGPADLCSACSSSCGPALGGWAGWMVSPASRGLFFPFRSQSWYYFLGPILHGRKPRWQQTLLLAGGPVIHLPTRMQGLFS